MGIDFMKVVPSTDPNITLGMALQRLRPDHLFRRQAEGRRRVRIGELLFPSL